MTIENYTACAANLATSANWAEAAAGAKAARLVPLFARTASWVGERLHGPTPANCGEWHTYHQSSTGQDRVMVTSLATVNRNFNSHLQLKLRPNDSGDTVYIGDEMVYGDEYVFLMKSNNAHMPDVVDIRLPIINWETMDRVIGHWFGRNRSRAEAVGTILFSRTPLTGNVWPLVWMKQL